MSKENVWKKVGDSVSIEEKWKDSFIGKSTDHTKVLDPFQDIQTLLSSLEGEKKRADITEKERSRLSQLLIEERIRIVALEERVKELEDLLAKKICGSLLCHTEKVQVELNLQKLVGASNNLLEELTDRSLSYYSPVIRFKKVLEEVSKS